MLAVSLSLFVRNFLLLLAHPGSHVFILLGVLFLFHVAQTGLKLFMQPKMTLNILHLFLPSEFWVTGVCPLHC